jgi:hypothetical protein
MSPSPQSPTSPGSPRALKRQKLDHDPSSDNGGNHIMTEEEMVEREMGLPIEHVKTYENELDYRNKLVLAPMVRTGSCELSLYAWGSVG